MKDCIFCAIARGEIPANIVLEDDQVIGFLDRAPLLKGHVLVAPRVHVPDLDELPAELIEPVFRAAQRVSRVFPKVFGSDGSYTGINTRVSQSVPHVHVHVVPRYRIDELQLPWIPRPGDRTKIGEYGDRLRAAIDGAG